MKLTTPVTSITPELSGIFKINFSIKSSKTNRFATRLRCSPVILDFDRPIVDTPVMAVLSVPIESEVSGRLGGIGKRKVGRKSERKQ